MPLMGTAAIYHNREMRKVTEEMEILRRDNANLRSQIKVRDGKIRKLKEDRGEVWPNGSMSREEAREIEQICIQISSSEDFFYSKNVVKLARAYILLKGRLGAAYGKHSKDKLTMNSMAQCVENLRKAHEKTKHNTQVQKDYISELKDCPAWSRLQAEWKAEHSA